jgi:hypothetical protein
MHAEQTYHFGIPTPLDTPADARPSPDDWLTPSEALKAVGLWIRNEADRRAWQSYYSPLVRYAVRDGDQWLSFKGPYRVMLNGSLRGFEAFNELSRRQNLDILQRAGLSNVNYFCRLTSIKIAGYSSAFSSSSCRFAAASRAR